MKIVSQSRKAFRQERLFVGQSPRHLLCIAAVTAALTVWASSQTIPVKTPSLPGRLSPDTVLLPNGWKLSPAGDQIPVGGMPLNVIAIPNTNLAISTSNGYSDHVLSLIDLDRHDVVQQVPIAAGWMGLAVTADGQTVYASAGGQDNILVFHLRGRRLSSDGEITLPPGAFPSGITLNGDDSRLFISANLADSVLAVDTASRKVVFRGATGHKPYACAFVQKRHAVYVSNLGEDNLTILDADDGHLIARVVVHEKPSAILASSDGERVFVTNGDRNIVSIIDTATQRVAEEIDISLDRTPLAGSMPDGLALSPDGHTLFVANADNNSVAVVDVTARLHSVVLGFLPSGWFPTSVAVAGRGKEQKLVIANGKGGQSYENGTKWTPGVANNPNPGYIGRVLQGTISVVPLVALRKLPLYTRQVRNNSPFNTPVFAAPPPFPLGPGGPIKHVIYIIKENRTYDQVLGDMPEGNGEPSYAIFGSQVTPNQHAMARQFNLIDNLYHNAEISATGHFWTDSAIASEYVEKLWPSVNSGRGGKARLDFHDDPDDYPTSGFIWDMCAKKGLSYRSYGEFGRVHGAPEGDVHAAMASLQGHVSPTYRGADAIATVSDSERYAIWKREFTSYVKQGYLPTFEVISLPGDHTVGTRPGAQTPRAMVAENDLALGRMVDDISHSPFWKDTAIFVIEDDAQNGPDHIDCHRTTAFVVSPYVRRKFVDHTMYSAVSVVRTMELLLGLAPMTQYDAAATPMWSLFQRDPDLGPFTALSALISTEELNTKNSYGAALSLKMRLDEADEEDDGQLNEILWKSIRGADAQMPSRRLKAQLAISPPGEVSPTATVKFHVPAKVPNR
jgi:YVTN family beta-propeller protein